MPCLTANNSSVIRHSKSNTTRYTHVMAESTLAGQIKDQQRLVSGFKPGTSMFLIRPSQLDHHNLGDNCLWCDGGIFHVCLIQ